MAFPFLEKEGFVLEGKENVSGKPSCSEQSGLICEYLASNHGPTVPEECFMFFWLLLGKERLPLSSGAEKLIGESLREALLSTSRMRGRFCLNRLQARLGVNSSLGWIAGLCGFQALLKLPSSLLLAVCLLLKAPMFDTGQREESSKGRYPEHGFLRSVPPARA